VQGAQTLTVKLSNQKEFKANVIGRDPDSDVAVIKIEPDVDLAVATFADSDQLRVGQYAIACGSASGFQGSFSFGHVSALGRSQLPLPGLRFEDFIQTDAAINPGNSGGPLCNINGQVIGINIAIVAGANSIGFAIPINTAKRIVPQLISQGRVVRGFLGVGVTNADSYATALGLPDTNGAFVKTVQPGSPADKAGLKPYDVIRAINGTPVQNASALLRVISDLQPGSQARLDVWRNRQPMNIDVTLAEFKAEERPEQQGGPAPRGDIGVDNLSGEMAAHLGLPHGTTGILVTSVNPLSPWANAGITEGDVITEIAQQPVRDVREFSKLVEKFGTPGSTVLVGYYSQGTFDIAAVKFGAGQPATPVPPQPQPQPGR
jgi:serine protease Do